MSEKELEKLFVKEVRKAGGNAYKFVSPGQTGVPDRLVIFPGNHIGFVELKAPGKKPRPDQQYQQRKLLDYDCFVTNLDNQDSIEAVIQKIKNWGKDDMEILLDTLEESGVL